MRPAVYLPKPYLDEILYSVVARYAARSGISNLSVLNKSLFDSPRTACVDVPNRLRRFAEASSRTLDLSAGECLEKLTLAPYYFAYLSGNDLERCSRAMLDTSSSSVPNLIGIATSHVRPPKYLRFCEECRQGQRQSFGEAYWVRTHQLPGVLICPDHALLLSESDLFYRREAANAYVSAESATARSGVVGIWENDPIFGDLARASKAVLYGQGASWEDHCFLLASLKSGLRIKGESRSLTTQFRSFFGQRILRELGCDVDPEQNYNWFAALIRSPDRGFHPLRHILANYFAQRRDDSDRSLPGKRRGVSFERLPVGSRSGTERIKHEWQMLIDLVPSNSRYVARAVRPDLYEQLIDADPACLSPSNRRYNRKPRNRKQVNWSERDEIWADRLREGSTRVIDCVPVRRLTRTNAVQAAALPRAVRTPCRKLPKCRQALLECCEDIDTFHCRKLAEAQRRLIQDGREPTQNEIRQAARLTGPIGPMAKSWLARRGNVMQSSGPKNELKPPGNFPHLQ